MGKRKYRHKRQTAQMQTPQHAPQVGFDEEKKVTVHSETRPVPTAEHRSDLMKLSRSKQFVEWAKHDKNFTDWCVAAFTFVLAVAAIYQFSIMNGQLDSMRKDQRAWVTVSVGDPQFTKDGASGNMTVSVPAVVTNSGKTPARQSSTDIVVDTVENGQSPTFAFDDVPRTWSTIGVILPNAPFKVDAPMLRSLVKGHPEPRVLSTADYQELVDGKDYIVICARSTYVDIFGKAHWHHFCAFNSPSTKGTLVTARACTNYNDVDND
jgi:hypothetical protein